MAEETQEYLDLEGLTEFKSKVNDMTTGINLLRGTRDFISGVNFLDTLFCFDGFGTANQTWTKVVDSDGFTAIGIERSGTGSGNGWYRSSLVEIGDSSEFTVSGKVKLSTKDFYVRVVGVNESGGESGGFITFDCNALGVDSSKF